MSTRSFRNKHESVYASERDCGRYDEELCRRQDHAGVLLDAICAAAPSLSSESRVADLGAGTGKLARLLAPSVASVAVVDRAGEALVVARAVCASDSGLGDCALSFHEADLRSLPLADRCVDLTVAGWAVSYLKSEYETWYPDGSSCGSWRREVDRAIDEMDRVLADGGTCVVLETQGTATEAASRTGSHLYAHLRARGFEESVVRTDYRFPSKRLALETLLFFFGKGVAAKARKLLEGVADEGEPCTVPECTGLWSRRKRAAPEGGGARKLPRRDGPDAAEEPELGRAAQRRLEIAAAAAEPDSEGGDASPSGPACGTL